MCCCNDGAVCDDADTVCCVADDDVDADRFAGVVVVADDGVGVGVGVDDGWCGVGVVSVDDMYVVVAVNCDDGVDGGADGVVSCVGVLLLTAGVLLLMMDTRSPNDFNQPVMKAVAQTNRAYAALHKYDFWYSNCVCCDSP